MSERGCGRRVKGGIYAEVPESPFGMPVEHFLLEPPAKVDPEALGLTPIGVQLLERDGAWHVLDWVGAEHYPHVADFVEEARRMGVSRRLPRTLDFSKLGPQSRLLLVHSRAYRDDWRENLEGTAGPCPKGKTAHEAQEGNAIPDICIRDWWYDYEPAELREDPADPHSTVRAFVSATFPAYPERTEGIFSAPAIFGSFPLARIAVVRDPEDGTHEGAAALAAHADLPVVIEDE